MKISIKNLIKNRIVIFIVLLAILTSLCIYYIDNYQLHPFGQEISPNNKNFTAISGTVTQTFNGGFYTTSSNGTQYKILSSINVSNNDKIQLQGTISPNNTIIPTKIIVSPNWSFQFVILRSFLALLVLAFFFFKYWKFNFQEKIFIRRK